MKSVIIAACGAVALADVSDETVLLQVRTRKDPMAGTAAGGFDNSWEPQVPAGTDPNLPPASTGADGKPPPPPPCPPGTNCDPAVDPMPMPDDKPDPNAFFAQFEGSENFIEDLIAFCDADQENAICIFLKEEVEPLVESGDVMAIAGTVEAGCEDVGGYDCEDMGLQFAAEVDMFLMMKEANDFDDSAAGFDDSATGFDDSAGHHDDHYHFTPCEKFAVHPIWWEWESGEDYFWPASAQSCEMETSTCGMAPWCHEEWAQEWAHEDPYCHHDLPIMYEDHDGWFTCADPFWHAAHPPCASEHEFVYGDIHASGLPTIEEKPVAFDALCRIEFDCSNGWKDEMDHMCLCDNFHQADPAELMYSWNYYHVEEKCNANQATDDTAGTWTDTAGQEGDATGADGTWALAQKRASAMYSKNPALAKRLMSNSARKSVRTIRK